MANSRKVIDCRSFPSESNCSLTISGREDEVMKAAVEHAVSSHGHVDSPQLREGLRATMRDEREVTSAR
jgi:predicted small metal-binding protein